MCVHNHESSSLVESGSGSASGTGSESRSNTMLSVGLGFKSGLGSHFVSTPNSISQLKVGGDIEPMEGEGELDFGVSVWPSSWTNFGEVRIHGLRGLFHFITAPGSGHHGSRGSRSRGVFLGVRSRGAGSGSPGAGTLVPGGPGAGTLVSGFQGQGHQFQGVGEQGLWLNTGFPGFSCC